MAPVSRADRLRAARNALLGLGAICVALLAALYGLAVRTAAGQRLDDRLRGYIGPEDDRFASATQELLDTISVSSLALVGAAIMGIAVMRGRPRRAIAVGVMILGANVTTQALKHTLPRPELQDMWWTDPNSFPSGHTTVAMSLAMGLLLVTPATMRTAAAIVGGAYALGVGIAVIALNWHRPSDVVGAYLVATAWTCLVAAALTLRPDRPARRRGSPRAARALGLALTACIAAFLILVGLASADQMDVLHLVGDRTGFVLAAVLCSAAGGALITAVAVLVTRANRAVGPPAR